MLLLDLWLVLGEASFADVPHGLKPAAVLLSQLSAGAPDGNMVGGDL